MSTQSHEGFALFDRRRVGTDNPGNIALRRVVNLDVRELDPLGTLIEDGPELYFTLIRNMAVSFKSCMAEAS